MADRDKAYYIFKRDEGYEVSCLMWYEGVEEYRGRFTGWKYTDREKAERIAYCLNHLHDALAIQYFIEMVGE